MRTGFAVDVGTTNLEVSLWDLDARTCSCRRIVRSSLCAYGADVVSRILYAHYNSVEPLRARLTDQLSGIFREMSGSSFLPDTVVFTGNTVMLHLLSSLSVEGFERSPFMPVSLFGLEPDGSSPLGAVARRVVIPRCIDAFLGADITCAALAVKKERMSVSGQTGQFPYAVIDIGTNTEILLVTDDDHASACSTAAGPAFEGGGLSTGMKGSALVAELARMLEECIMDETGFIDDERAGEAPLNQQDVRRLQLAKGAVSAAFETLLHEEGLDAAALAGCYICGNFGNALDLQAVRETGLLPAAVSGKAFYSGNAALRGAELILLGDCTVEDTAAIASGARLIQLADSAFFAEKYIKRMNFGSF